MRKLWLIVFKARVISMAYLWWPWPWGQTSANTAVTSSLGSPGTQDSCAVSVVAHPPSRSQYPKHISLSAFCPRVLFSVLLKPPACSQYSGTFCRYRMLPCSWTSERGSEGFRLIVSCGLWPLSGRGPHWALYPEGLVPTRWGHHLIPGQGPAGEKWAPTAWPLLPSPSNLGSIFCFHFLWVGITQSALDLPVLSPLYSHSALYLESPSHQSRSMQLLPSSLPPRLLFPGLHPQSPSPILIILTLPLSETLYLK